MQRDLDYDRQFATNKQEAASSIPRTHRPMNRGHYSNDQFARSASARLPRNKDEQLSERDGEKKREESMKRLLEWKQRMLQSPLTRKGVPVNMTSSAKLQIPQKGMNQGLQRSRSETNANAGYNSYSSDDEGKSKSFFYSLNILSNFYNISRIIPTDFCIIIEIFFIFKFGLKYFHSGIL